MAMWSWRESWHGLAPQGWGRPTGTIIQFQEGGGQTDAQQIGRGRKAPQAEATWPGICPRTWWRGNLQIDQSQVKYWPDIIPGSGWKKIYLKPPARSAGHERLEPCCPGPSATSLYPWRLLQRLPGWSRQTTKCQPRPPRTKPLRPLPGVGLGMPWSVKVSGLLNVPWRRCQGSALATRLFFGPCGKRPTPRFSGIPKSTAYHHFLNKDVNFGSTTAFFEKPISSGCFQTLQESALQNCGVTFSLL